MPPSKARAASARCAACRALLLRLSAGENAVFHGSESVMTLTAQDGGTELVWQTSFFPEPSPLHKSQCKLVQDELGSRFGADSDDIAAPTTVPELVALVQKALDEGMSVRAVGSARSLSDAPEPADNSQLVSTCQQGGGQFQSVAGLLLTASHGSGIDKPSVPDLIAGLELVTVDADGKVVAQRIEPSDGPTDPAHWDGQRDVPTELVQDDDRFHAAVVSLGSMGVLYSLTLKLVPGFYLHEQRTVRWWSEVKPQLDQLLQDNDYFELVLAPIQSAQDDGTMDNAVLTSERNEVDATSASGRRPLLMDVATTEIGRAVAGVTLEWALKNPPKRVPWVLNTGVHSSAVSSYTDKNYHVLQLNLDVNAASTEQNVAVEDAVAAIDAVLAHCQQRYDAFAKRFPIGTGTDFDADVPFDEDPDGLNKAWQELAFPTSPLGIRFVPATDAFMAPFYQRATCTIEMPMTGSDYLDQRALDASKRPSALVQLYTAYLSGRRTLFEQVEQLLIEQFDARPHWGQANYLDREAAMAASPGFSAWLEQYQAYNPKGTFNGAFTGRMDIVSLVASTQNLVDPVVVELRFSPEGELESRTDDWALYHSFSQNRQYGEGTFDGERLHITGDAAAGLRAFVNAGRLVSAEAVEPKGPVLLRLIDMETGEWAVASL